MVLSLYSKIFIDDAEFSEKNFAKVLKFIQELAEILASKQIKLEEYERRVTYMSQREK